MSILAGLLGAARTTEHPSPPEHARELQDIVLDDSAGQPVRLGDLWRDQPAVLIFLRHYGCLFSRDYVVALHRDRHRFAAAGARLVAIGPGTPAQASRFLEDHGAQLPLLVDPGRRSYRAAGARTAALVELVGPRIVMRGVIRMVDSRLARRRVSVSPGRMMHHGRQLGGVLVVAPDGSVRYAHISQDASDNPPLREVLSAVRAIRPHSEPR